MKQYKIIKGYFNETVEKLLKVPDDMVFLCNPEEVGNCLHQEHAHYLGITSDKTFSEGLKFGDSIILKLFNDIKPIDKLPIINSKEAEEKFHFSNYYIYQYTNQEYTYIEGDWKIIPERLFSCLKILEFNSPYNISVCDVCINSWMSISDIEVKSIIKNKIDFNSMYNVFKGYSIITKDSTLFNKSFKEVLENCKIDLNKIM